MRKGQGLPVNMIVLTALALLVLIVIGAFFISGFGDASSSVAVLNATQTECQGMCQELTSSAFNYNDCLSYDSAKGTYDGVGSTGKAKDYVCKCENFGVCTVTLRNAQTCSIGQGIYETARETTWDNIATSVCGN